MATQIGSVIITGHRLKTGRFPPQCPIMCCRKQIPSRNSRSRVNLVSVSEGGVVFRSQKAAPQVT